jgi:glycosyltransferase involved in cell wall biosynthesis
MMRKLLYIDVPFSGIPGGDKHRSQFIWDILSKYFDADLLLIKTPEFLTTSIPEHNGFDQIFAISSHTFNPLKAKAIHQFSKANRDKFIQILTRKRYEIVVFRFLSCAELINLAQKHLPECEIVIDVDMLLSRLADLTWKQNPTMQNRYYWVEYFKLKQLENSLFHQPHHFFFTNYTERDLALDQYKLDKATTSFHTFPNMMPDPESLDLSANVSDAEKLLLADKYILFFGTLNSAANTDAFQYLAKEIFPRVSKKLQDKDVKIYVVGKNLMAMHEQYAGGRLKIIGPVSNINAFISASLFVALPIRIATGTRTRILEAAALKKAVLTTSIGAEGFEFSPEEIVIEDRVEDYCNKLIYLLQTPEKTAAMGEKLYEKSIGLYSQEKVKTDFINFLNNLHKSEQKPVFSKRLRIAIVTNRFYPEVGGAETNIYFQACKLAEQYEVSVFCPRRINKPKVEIQDGFTVYRLFDVMNYPPEIPNLKAKTLCPELITLLIKGKYDIIQCFPAINYNNLLAFLTAKLLGIPYILCAFDFVDYAAIIKEHGSIDPDLLKNHQPGWKERLLLRHADYIFAISEKEIAFYQQYNNQIEYSPVPILTAEYEQPSQPIRQNVGLTDDNFIFLSLGRVSYIKGQDIALKAFAKALPSLPGAKLVYVGRADYEPEFFEDMQALISREQISDHVIFTGMLERADVLAWLKDADIHVIPVRFMNSGAVVVESWISDTPVLQSDVVDPNLVIEDFNGFLFKSEDIDELSRQMIKAYQNKDKLAELAAHGKILVKEKYTYEYLIKLYTRAYRQLLAD